MTDTQRIIDGYCGAFAEKGVALPESLYHIAEGIENFSSLGYKPNGVADTESLTLLALRGFAVEWLIRQPHSDPSVILHTVQLAYYPKGNSWAVGNVNDGLAYGAAEQDIDAAIIKRIYATENVQPANVGRGRGWIANEDGTVSPLHGVQPVQPG